MSTFQQMKQNEGDNIRITRILITQAPEISSESSHIYPSYLHILANEGDQKEAFCVGIHRSTFRQSKSISLFAVLEESFQLEDALKRSNAHVFLENPAAVSSDCMSPPPNFARDVEASLP